jgi:hypothetical protein
VALELGSTPAIDVALESIRSLIVPKFTDYWSNHIHQRPVDKTETCNLTLTADGNWKLGRLKCIYAGDTTNIKTKELGLIQTGCRSMPLPRSYYCKVHTGHEIKFRFRDTLQSLNPLFIKPSRLGKFLII